MARPVILHVNSQQDADELSAGFLGNIAASLRLDEGDLANAAKTPVVYGDNNDIEYNYSKRVESIANAAEYALEVLRLSPAAAKEFNAYIRKLEKQYQAEIKAAEDIKSKQACYVEYLRLLEHGLVEQVLPKVTKQFPHAVEKRKRIAGSLLEFSDAYSLLKTPREVLVTVTKNYSQDGDDVGYLVQTEIPEPAISVAVANEYLNRKSATPPLWYKHMPAEEKIFLEKTLEGANTVEKIQERLFTLSTRLRTLPGVANFSRHVTMAVDSDGNTLGDVYDHYRSSIISSRSMVALKVDEDNIDDKHEMNVDVAKQNILKIIEAFLENKYSDADIYDVDPAEIENLPILLQTLISPAKLFDALPETGGIPNKFSMENKLYQLKQEAIAKIMSATQRIVVGGREFDVEFKNLLDTNHPLNYVRHAAGWGSLLEQNAETNTESVKKLIALVDERVETLHDKKLSSALLDAADYLSDLADVKIRWTDDQQRELHMAVLEEFIVVRLGGLAHGSCLSGKDRKGTQLLYLDAFEEYFRQTGKLPRLSDAENFPDRREQFTDIVADIFVSGHEQYNSGQSSIGAAGIKTPEAYLAGDVKDKIIAKSGNPNIFSQSSRLGDNNNISKTLKSKHFITRKEKRPLSIEKKLESSREFFKPSKKNKKDYDGILNALLELRGNLSEEVVGKAVLKEIDARIDLVKKIPHLRTLMDHIEKFESAMMNLPKSEEKKFADNAMQQYLAYQHLCQQAITLVKSERGLLATPVYVEAVVKKIIRTPDDETEHKAIERMTGKHIETMFKNPQPINPSGRISTVKQSPGTPTEKIHIGDMRVNTLKADSGLMAYTETLHDGQAISTIYLIPNTLNSQMIWENFYSSIDNYTQGSFIDKSKFMRIFNELQLQPAFYSDGEKFDECVSGTLNRYGVMDNKIIGFIVNEYHKRRTAMFDQKTGIPHDDMIKLVHSQMVGLNEIKKGDPLIIDKASSEAYVRAAMLLYAVMQGNVDLDKKRIKNESKFKYVEIPTKKEIEQFRSYLMSRPDLGYHDKADTQKKADKLLARRPS